MRSNLEGKKKRDFGVIWRRERRNGGELAEGVSWVLLAGGICNPLVILGGVVRVVDKRIFIENVR